MEYDIRHKGDFLIDAKQYPYQADLWNTVNICIFCGSTPDTRDHNPPKVFLDKDYPSNLMVVPCCANCNSSFSLDEEYVACIIECTKIGTTDPDKIEREKIAKTLRSQPSLRKKINAARDTGGFDVELNRAKTVVIKIARGILKFELAELVSNQPRNMMIEPICSMEELAWQIFNEKRVPITTWPEIGSRAFQRAVEGNGRSSEKRDFWKTIQGGRFRYMIDKDPFLRVRMVINEYLACDLTWDR